MKVLIVEDDQDFTDELRETLEGEGAQCTFAANKEAALMKIRDEFFDLILLDLNIPTSDGALDGDPVHGHSVFGAARVDAPGTPVIVLTGSSAEKFIPSLLEHSAKVDVWGGAQLQMVAFHPKHKLDQFPALLAQYRGEVGALRIVELKRNGLTLSESEERLIRIFARNAGGTKVAISEISGGLSGTRVLRLKVTNAAGMVVHNTVSKIGEPRAIRDEDEKYTKYVSRLPPEATPRKLKVLEHGGKATSGIFYGLAEGFEQNAFDIVQAKSVPVDIVDRIAKLVSRWAGNVESRRAIRDIRRRFLTDDKAELVKQQVAWAEPLEDAEIQVKWNCAHGDLHGLNVLVSEEGTPILIDYGDAGDGPSSMDAVTLELCLFFHPKGPLRASQWPSKDQALLWGDLDRYLIDCPYPDFVRACRKWALDAAAGEREVAAVAYSYLLRQLRYRDVDTDRARSLMEGVKAYYDQT
ncbi:response regulator [Paraburkholderia sp. SIMBA_049]